MKESLVNTINGQDPKQALVGHTLLLITTAQRNHGLDVFIAGPEACPFHVTLQVLMAQLAVSVLVHHLERLLHYAAAAAAAANAAVENILELLVPHEPVFVGIRRLYHGPNGALVAAAARKPRVERSEIVPAYLAIPVNIDDVECRPKT